MIPLAAWQMDMYPRGSADELLIVNLPVLPRDNLTLIITTTSLVMLKLQENTQSALEIDTTLDTQH